MVKKERIAIAILIITGITLISRGSANDNETGKDNSTPTDEKERGITITDRDGNGYRSVTIGKQVWMLENLGVTHYLDGTAIPFVSDNDEWSNLTTGAYCYPAIDSSSHNESYGVLYNFHAVNDSRGICPEGWHVPSATEWRCLIDYLGGIEVAGGKMKENRSGLWKILVTGTTNESGFSAFPAGGRGRFGSASDEGYYATWWSSTSHNSAYAWHWGLHPDKNSIRSNPGHKSSGFSVRCIKD
jgi:uncharacterized protein (TIGR02145 family)